MAIRRRSVGNIVILYPRGNFFGDTETDELEKALMDEAASGNTRMLLNMQEVQRLNSTAIGVVMRGYANYKGRSGEMKLCCLGKSLKDLFTMIKLIMVLDHRDTEEEALAAFAE